MTMIPDRASEALGLLEGAALNSESLARHEARVRTAQVALQADTLLLDRVTQMLADWGAPAHSNHPTVTRLRALESRLGSRIRESSKKFVAAGESFLLAIKTTQEAETALAEIFGDSTEQAYPLSTLFFNTVLSVFEVKGEPQGD